MLNRFFRFNEKLFFRNKPVKKRNITAMTSLNVIMVSGISSRKAILRAINEFPQNNTASRIRKYLK